MAGYILGLDLGPSSIGWAAIQADKEENPTGFIQLQDGEKTCPAVNSRIFPAGVENLGQGQNEKTRNKKRRESRGSRRVLRRRRARRLKLKNLLKQNNMLPDEDTIERSPYELRQEALKGKIELKEIGRILLHFTKRRGFKSNRKDLNKEKDSGKVNEARTKFKEILNGKTPGQFWQEQKEENDREPIRNRKSQYKWIAERQQYLDELSRVWKEQQKAYPSVLTKELHDKISEILFNQIPYEISNTKKRKVIGYCSLIKGKLRCDYSYRIAQEFRLLQKLNDLEVRRKGEKLKIEPGKREKLYEKLMTSKSVPFEKVREILGIKETDKINFEFEGNDSLTGNEIDCQITKRGLIDEKTWLKLNEEDKEEIWQKILDYFNYENITLEETAEQIKKLSGYDIKKPEAVSNITIPAKTIKYSKEALEQIVPYMREGLDLHDAINKAGFVKKYRTLKKLPLPDESNGYRISNPNVKVVLFELRKLINRIIAEIGKPQKIVIEFTRDIKASKDVRQQIQRQQSNRRKLKEQIKKDIAGLEEWAGGDDVPAWAVEKYILWYEQKFHSPYSGDMIGLEQLFTRDIEVDHILPYSMSLDNSMNNKVICFAKENQDKGQRTPFDWLGHDEDKWEIVAGSIDHYNLQRKTRGRNHKRPQLKANMDLKELACENKDKWQRFYMTADQIEEVYWQPRFIPETGYIAREVRDYLKRLYPYKIANQKVVTTKGGITGELRKWWDLNRILGDGDEKKRDDLRHHAVDAAVIACTNQKIIKNITNKIQKAWPRKRPSEIDVDRPWENFENDLEKAVSKINVSHRVQRGVKGQLHKEKFYRKQKEGIYKGKYTIKKPLDGDFNQAAVERICDYKIRNLVKERLEKYNNDTKKAFLKPLYLIDKSGSRTTKVNSVVVYEDYKDENMIEIRQGVYVVRPENHHIEIFRIYGNGKNELRCKTWDTWDIRKRIEEERRNKIKGKNTITLKKHPDFPEAEFIMSLCKGESVELDGRDGERVLARVKEVGKDDNNGKSTDLKLWEVQVGKLEGSITKETKAAYRIRSMKEFDKLNIRKVTVDLLGRVRRAKD